MWRRMKSDEFGLLDVLKLLHAGIAAAVTAKIEYRGKEYPVRIGEPENPPPPPSLSRYADSPSFLSARLEEKLFGKSDDAIRFHTEQVPWLTLPAGYSFKATFPFAGAAARFRVCKADQPGRSISVYLDTKDVLGCVGEPYWEAYPIKGDTERFLLCEGEQLIAAVVAELEREGE